MNWLLLALLTAFFYGAYNFLIKVSSNHINQIAGAVVLQLTATLLGAAALLFLKVTHAPILISSRGIYYAILAGLFVGLAEITTFFVFSKGIAASIGIPIIIGGAVIFGALLGWFILKENFSLLHFLALILISVGVVMLVKS